MSTTEKVRREAGDSDALDRGIRLGLVSYGITHLVIAGTALPLVWGGESEGTASQQGAFAQMAQQPLGDALLWVMVVGLVCMAVWQAVEAGMGHRDEDGGKRVFQRVASGVKTVVYAVLAWTAASTAVGSGGSSGSGSTDGITAKLMSAPGGPWIVGAIGAAVVGVGGYLVYKGWTEGFTKRLDPRAEERSGPVPVVPLGKAGYVSKGVSLGVVGGLFVTAAVQHQPKESGGLDVALHQLLQQPMGPVLLAVVALGLGCFGLYCFAWARYLRR